MPLARKIRPAHAVAVVLVLFLSHSVVGADEVPAQRLQRLASFEEAGETVIVVHTDGRVSNWTHTTVVDPDRIVIERELSLRYRGQSHEIDIPWGAADPQDAFVSALCFIAQVK